MSVCVAGFKWTEFRDCDRESTIYYYHYYISRPWHPTAINEAIDIDTALFHVHAETLALRKAFNTNKTYKSPLAEWTVFSSIFTLLSWQLLLTNHI